MNLQLTKCKYKGRESSPPPLTPVRAFCDASNSNSEIGNNKTSTSYFSDVHNIFHKNIIFNSFQVWKITPFKENDKNILNHYILG
jgi:hypothetical protein